MPCLPTTSSIKHDINTMLETGVLSLGEPCTPFSIVRSRVADGVVQKKTIVVYGRKIPLSEIRAKLLQKQEKYMHLLSDEVIDSMEVHDLESYIHGVKLDDLQSQLKSLQRTRHLALWHDHSTILGEGYILITVHVLYDSAVFLTSSEYRGKTGEDNQLSLQQLIEEPELYILCLSSSSPSDQVASISDRLDCLPGLQNAIRSSSGVMVHDKLLYFVGDHPAKAFERGSQIGGNYKCGNCGTLANRMDDLGHVLRRSWRSLQDLQNLVLQGSFGKKLGVLKKLKKSELQEELLARGHINVDFDKKALSDTLVSILEGAQRVPTILFSNPSQSLADLNLSEYTVLDCEPLHDLKGHLINLLTELPYVLNGQPKTLCDDLLRNILFSKRQNGF
jgi:hypothetical protein